VKPKAMILIGFVAAVGAILATSLRRDEPAEEVKSAVARTEPDPPVTITFVYSTEKKDWLEAAVAGFRTAHPEITVDLVGKGSLEATQQILDGALQPTVFSPADSLVMNLLASDWETKNGRPLFGQGDDAPQPLLLSPLVFVAWEDRAKVLLEASGGALSWKAIHKAVTSPKGWPAVGGKPQWGFVKLGHTDPTKSNSGLQALLSMSLEYWGKNSLEVGDLLDEKYQAFVRDIERGVTRFETSTGTFMTDMVRFGPSKYDLAVVYESLAVSQIENAQGRWGNLRIYYPTPTLWSDHPVAVLDAAWVTPAQRTAARALVAYLRSQPVQATALASGFRPADTSVPLRTDATSNPFTRLASYGIALELPPVAAPPDGALVRNLMTMWSRVVQAR
jgi:ABC-type Fe3+ transport system substrate-binding protein